MICQISKIKTKTAPLPKIDRGSVEAKHLQPHLKSRDDEQSDQEHFWSPMTAGPYLVPVSRWVE